MEKYIHENHWDWGLGVNIMLANGAATVHISLEDEDPGVAYINGLSVVSEYRKKGLATQLMREAEDYCKNHNIFRIDLTSVPEEFVRNFYHKLGFVDIKETDGYMKMYKMLK